MATLASIRHRLLSIPRPPSSSRQASSSSSPNFNDLAQKASQKASQLASQYGAHVPQLTENVAKRFNGLLGSYSEPLVYNFNFAKEVLKQVYIKEHLAPPRVEQIRTCYLEMIKNASSIGFWKQTLESGDWKRMAVYGVEAVGLFSIGEMIGRRHVVGYKLD